MDVAVTTIVKDRAGKLKREAHATVHMVFHGYNQSGKFTVSSRSGLLDRKELHDSMNGDLAVFAAGTLLLKRRGRSNLQVHQPTQTGQPFLVKIDDQDCPEFKIIGGRVLFPVRPSFCGSATFSLSGNTTSDLAFEHFRFEASRLPARAKIADFGDVEILTFRVEEDFQNWFLPGEPKPFLLPKKVLISVATNKGEVDFTNQYTPRAKN